VAGSTFTDAAGNNNSAASQFNWTYDGTLPTITGVSLASDNSTIAVTFSEAVYTTAGASGSLETSDFVFSISGGSATLSSSTPSSISASSNTYTLGISLSGTANGSETLTVNPANSAIFDVVGNAASNSQSNNTATLNSANYVLELNGTNEMASYSHTTNLEPTDWSIQAWIDPNALPNSGNNMWVISKHQVYRLGLRNTGGTTKIAGEMRRDDGSSSWEQLEGTTLANANGGWYHVVLTFDASADDFILYVNGSAIDNNLSYSGATNSNNSDFVIGNRNASSTAWYQGRVDEVAFWDAELSANAVSVLYNSGSGLSASSSSGNYTFSGDLMLYLKMQQDLNDSEGSYNFTGSGIQSSDYISTDFD